MIKEGKITFRNPALGIIVCDVDGIKVQITGEFNEYDGIVYLEEKAGAYTPADKPVAKSTEKADDTPTRKPKKSATAEKTNKL